MPGRVRGALRAMSGPSAAEDEIIAWLRDQQLTEPSLLYEDPDFSCSARSSLYLDPSRIPDYASPSQETDENAGGDVAWLRPTEYAANPAYFTSSSGCGVLREGAMDDAWLLGVFAAVALHPDHLVENLFVSESLDAFKRFGVFTCRFYKDDDWVAVTTDTRIPCAPSALQAGDQRGSGAVLYGGSADPNEVFLPLLEKAYAKLHGSYQALDERHGGGAGGSAGTSAGRILEAFLDCTGGSAHRVDLLLERAKQQQFEQTTAPTAASASSPSTLLWKQLARYSRSKCILTTQLRQLSFNAQDVTALGLLKNRQYVIRYVTEVASPSSAAAARSGSSSADALRFVKLQSVWGRGQWRGDWSNDDSKWEEHAQVEQTLRSDPRAEFSRSCADGCFWMLWTDLLASFSELFVVHVFGSERHQYGMRGDWVGAGAAGAPATSSPGGGEDPHAHTAAGGSARRKEHAIAKTRWSWLPDAEPNWHRNPQFTLAVPLGDEQPMAGVLLSLAQRDFRLHGGDNFALNLVLLREKPALESPSAVWELKRGHVVAEAHSTDSSFSTGESTPPTPLPAGHPTTPSTTAGAMATPSGQPKPLPERELVREDVTLAPGATYYLVPYTTSAKVEMEFFLRVVAPRPLRVERVPPLQSIVRSGRWRAGEDAAAAEASASASGSGGGGGEASNAGGPLLLLPLPQQGQPPSQTNPAWCQNPQFWLRFAERSPKLRQLLASKPHVTIKLVLRKTSHRSSMAAKTRQQREAARDRANFVGLTAVRVAAEPLVVPVAVGGSGSSAATQLRALSKGVKTNFLGDVVVSPYAKASALSRGLQSQQRDQDDVDDAELDAEAAPQPASGAFPSPKLVVKPSEWCRLSSYASPASACLFLQKVPKEWLLGASDGGGGGGGLLVVPTLGEPGAEGSFELQVDCDFPLLVDELPRGVNAVQSVPGAWTAAQSGGCHLHPQWRQNPTFHLQLQGVRPTKVRVTLSRSELEWKPRCRRDPVGTMMGFYLFRGGGSGANPAKLVRAEDESGASPILVGGRPWSETGFVPLHAVSSPPDLVLSAAAKGGYVIMPATYEPERLGRFVLSVQCDGEFALSSGGQ
ncbi:hypothetical protein BBJ28_00015205 [Nothophytophthora sp. Chile5]|nr:hypothetical protein BBJ28_00015205 [Nothophytophthora sp. Chile5]